MQIDTEAPPIKSLHSPVLGFATAVTTGLAIALTILLSATSAHAQQGAAVLIGTVKDASTGEPVLDAVVTVTSSSLQGEEIAVTDNAGAYRISNLPAGRYVLRIEKESFRPYAREALDLHVDTTIRLNASLLPEALKAQEVIVVGRTPTVDVGSSATGMNITSDFTSRIPLAAPGARGAASRSFESVADVVPGAQPDAFGVSIFGASSPENRYLLDGLSVGNATFGTLGTPLSIEFIKEISVLSGGYMPEYGRATGGILNAITKSGSNEYHGSVFMNFAPGALEGHRKTVRRQNSTVLTEPSLAYMGDIGGDVGGPIIRDKLWFYTGFDWSETKYQLDRSLYRTLFDSAGNPQTDASGDPRTELVPGTSKTFYAQQDTFQGIGKLTWAANKSNRVTLSLNGVYPVSGGNGKYGINPLTGQPEIGTAGSDTSSALNGEYSALAHRFAGSSTNALVKWSTELDGKRALLDTWLGFHNERAGRLPSDGSTIGSKSGLAGESNVWLVRDNPPYSIGELEKVPNGGCDAPSGNPDAVPCPAVGYRLGGPEYVEEQKTNRFQGRSVFTYLFQALGHHVLKAGADAEYQLHNGVRAYTGGRDFVDLPDGYIYSQVYGYLKGPDDLVTLNKIENNTSSVSVGGFIQDSWNVGDRVTLNLGVRNDAQMLYGRDGALAMTLPNQWSPRAGLIWDPTYEGRAKLFANFARYYESVPLRMLDRYLSGEPLVLSGSDPSVCDPTKRDQQTGSCLSDAGLFAFGDAPNTKFIGVSSGTSVIDPKLKAPSTDEVALGGDYEIVRDGRLGVSYTNRRLRSTIDDMSRDNGQTFFFGNPGYGIAKDFPKAERKYDALTLYFAQQLSQGWLGQVSYTASWLRGNYSGLFRPEDLQFDPHQNTDFDLDSLTTNRKGYLPGDHRHYIKGFVAKEIGIHKGGTLIPGGAFRGYSGEPTNYLGAHPIYLLDQVYILPRGEGERLPWTFSGDVRLAYALAVTKSNTITFSADVFNVFNFQGVASRDQRYTSSQVAPVKNGRLRDLKNYDGTPFDNATRNPNFGHATTYQAPRVFRFGVKGTF